MTENISSRAAAIFSQSIRDFSNLLKEFPKSAQDDFIYDESTIKKIIKANQDLRQMKTLVTDSSLSLDEETQRHTGKSLELLSQLMVELPKQAQDEFLYDPDIHQLVEAARDTIAMLQALFP